MLTRSMEAYRQEMLLPMVSLLKKVYNQVIVLTRLMEAYRQVILLPMGLKKERKKNEEQQHPPPHGPASSRLDPKRR